MPWKEVTVMSEKSGFIERYFPNDCTMMTLRKDYSISRKTGYRLVKRYQEEGLSQINPLSKRPHYAPHRTLMALEKRRLSVRDKPPQWGGVKIRTILLKEGVTGWPSIKTINTILKRYGRITESESEKHRPWIRFEHETPNDLWQMDFKGFLGLNDKSHCYPLT